MQAPVGMQKVVMNRPYGGRPEETEVKDVTTEEIQAMLDENSALIVDIIGLNNQIKHGKGTTQLSELTEKLDKKRKKLNKNLMTLAKWADESSDASPRPAAPPAAYMAPPQVQQYAARGMPTSQMAGNPIQPMGQNQTQAQIHAQVQAQAAQARYTQAQAQLQAQAQALARAQYQARLSSMGAHPQYAGAMAGGNPQHRYHDGGMAYGNPAAAPMMHAGQMNGPMGTGTYAPMGTAAMGYPQNFGMMPHHMQQQQQAPQQPQQQRMSPGPMVPGMNANVPMQMPAPLPNPGHLPDSGHPSS